MEKPVVEIDGSYGSGGGAILRVASALSAVTSRSVRVFNIRKGRPRPGLMPQHLEGLKAVAGLCGGRLEGAEPGSGEIRLFPGKARSGRLDVRIGTAGSIGLVFQTLKLPACVIGGAEITVEGGATFGKWAPPLEASRSVLLPVLERMGYRAGLRIGRHGFYPAGGARASIRVESCGELKPLVLGKLGRITHLGGISIASAHLRKARVAEKQARAAEQFLKGKGLKPMVKDMYVEADCPGSGVVLWASDGSSVLGGDCVGERNKRAEDVGREAAQRLYNAIESGATVDEKLSDQVLPFMALAKGESRIVAPRLTGHAKTNIWVLGKFLDSEFRTRETPRNVAIECSGK